MTQKKILIHIGPPKTGTSAIQSYCNTHKQLLLTQGILYPTHTVDSNGVSSGNVQSIYDRDDDNNLQISAKKVEQLCNEFESSDASILLLSSEFFFKRIMEVNKYFPTAQFIAYVRSPVDYLESSYNQTVKRHGNTNIIKPVSKLKFSALNQLENAVNIVGSDRFILRAYTTSHFLDNDIVSDFLSIFDIEKSSEYQPKTVNPSYSFEALEFKRWLNQFELEDAANVIDLVLQAFSVGQQKFSLLHPDVFANYKTQVLNYLNEYVCRLDIHGAQALIESVSKGKQNQYIEQGLTKEQFLEVKKHIQNESEFLFIRLCQLLYKQSYLPIFKDKYVEWFLQDHPISLLGKHRNWLAFLFSNMSFALKKNYLAGFLRYKLGKKKTLVWGDGESTVRGLKEFKSSLGLDTDVSNIGILIQTSKFCETNGNIPFAFYLIEDALKRDPENVVLNQRLEALEKKLALYLKVCR